MFLQAPIRIGTMESELMQLAGGSAEKDQQKIEKDSARTLLGNTFLSLAGVDTHFDLDVGAPAEQEVRAVQAEKQSKQGRWGSKTKKTKKAKKAKNALVAKTVDFGVGTGAKSTAASAAVAATVALPTAPPPPPHPPHPHPSAAGSFTA
jgi:hypothetical protein